MSLHRCDVENAEHMYCLLNTDFSVKDTLCLVVKTLRIENIDYLHCTFFLIRAVTFFLTLESKLHDIIADKREAK